MNTEHSFYAELTEKSYLDLFERDRLIYLSPHTEEKLTTEEIQDERNVFIIGGIVDRVAEPNIHPQASFVCAQEEGIRCRQFPLDDYMELVYTCFWLILIIFSRRVGNCYFTLTAVLQILQNVYDTGGDWRSTLDKFVFRLVNFI